MLGLLLCPWTWAIHTKDYYSAMERNELSVHSTLGGIATQLYWVKISQYQKAIGYILYDSIYITLSKWQNQRDGKQNGNRPWGTEWSRAKANRVLPRECTGHRKQPLPTTQGMTVYMDITRCSILNQIDYIICSQRWRGSIQSAKPRPGADCGSDHELLMAKFRLKLKKVGKTPESAYNSGDLGSMPGSGRCPGEGNGNPL